MLVGSVADVNHSGMTRFILFFVLCFARLGAAQASRDLRAEIQAVNDSMVTALAKGDMLAVARFYTDDARIDGPRGTLVQGRKAVDAYWTSIRGAKSWKLEVLAVGGPPDQPYQIGRSTLITSSPDGDRTSVVEFLGVWRRDKGGGLRLAIDFYR